MSAEDQDGMQPEDRVRGAKHDLASCLEAHVFVFSANNSGSTFVAKALARCASAWSLPTEGQLVFGFAGPKPRASGRHFIWAAKQQWIAEYRDPSRMDWSKTRRAWYAQATASDARARVFVEKSPPFLVLGDQLRTAFRNARFIMMVRDPLATCEGIIRARSRTATRSGEDIRTLAAQHVIHCFEQQSRNLKDLAGQCTLFTYEKLCEDPSGCAEQVRALLPQLNDLDFDIRLRIKGKYDERLRNMNDEQIARLGSADRTFIEGIFKTRRELFAEFGYRL